MIDIETLDTSDESLILSIAAVKFDQYQILDELVLYPDLKQQKDRKIDIDTLEWWLGHPKKFNRLMNIQRKSIDFVYYQLRCFMHTDDRKVWSKSPSFDLDILNNYFQKYPPIWKYSQECDVRTAYLKLKQKDMIICDPINPHEALSDAIAQTKNVQTFLKL